LSSKAWAERKRRITNGIKIRIRSRSRIRIKIRSRERAMPEVDS